MCKFCVVVSIFVMLYAIDICMGQFMSSVSNRNGTLFKSTFQRDIDRWFCHVDDDNYVNTDQLLKLLQNFNDKEKWYLGKPSLNHPWVQLIRNRTTGEVSGRDIPTCFVAILKYLL
jgi:hypothetical protein